MALENKGDYDGALAEHRKALNIWESILGKDHPNIAKCYNNIGSIKERKGDYRGALSEY